MARVTGEFLIHETIDLGVGKEMFARVFWEAGVGKKLRCGSGQHGEVITNKAGVCAPSFRIWAVWFKFLYGAFVPVASPGKGPNSSSVSGGSTIVS